MAGKNKTILVLLRLELPGMIPRRIRHDDQHVCYKYLEYKKYIKKAPVKLLLALLNIFSRYSKNPQLLVKVNLFVCTGIFCLKPCYMVHLIIEIIFMCLSCISMPVMHFESTHLKDVMMSIFVFDVQINLKAKVLWSAGLTSNF